MRSSFAWPLVGVAFFLVLGVAACTKSEDSDNGGASSSSSGGNSSSGSTSSGGTSGSTSGGTSGTTSSGNPAKPSKVNTTPESIEVDGTTRRYVLQVPKTYATSKTYPLIIALHGDGENATFFAQEEFPLSEFSGDDAILAYTENSEDLFTDYASNNDQRMVEVIIDALKTKYPNIDPNKVWGAGYSKGAYQLNQIACRKPGLLKAMAIHAGGAPQDRDGNDNVNCPTAIALPTFVTHGANDDPNGGKFGADFWAGLAGCADNLSASTPSICEKYNNCQAGSQVYFCVVPNWPHSPLYKEAAEHTWTWMKTL